MTRTKTKIGLRIGLFNFSLLLVLIVGVYPPHSVLAAKECGNDLEKQFYAIEGGKELLDTLPKVCTTGEAYQKFFNIAYYFVGILATIMVILGGFQIMTGSKTLFGEKNENSYLTGKNTVKYAIVGLIVVIMATTIVNIVVRLLV